MSGDLNPPCIPVSHMRTHFLVLLFKAMVQTTYWLFPKEKKNKTLSKDNTELQKRVGDFEVLLQQNFKFRSCKSRIWSKYITVLKM